MIILHDVNCNSWQLIQTHFQYAELRNTICSKNAGRVSGVVAASRVGASDKMLEIINSAQTPAQILEKTAWITREDGGGYRIDYEKLCAHLNEIQYTPCLAESLELVSDAQTILTQAQAYEVLLFAALFAYFGREPDFSDANQLRKYLWPDWPEGVKRMQKLALLQKKTELPCFPGCSESELKLGLCVIRNPLNDTALVTLKGSPLRQHLQRGERLLALTANGQVAAFLPRICVSRGQALYLKEGRLSATGGGNGGLNDPQIAFFAVSKECGDLLVADWAGNLRLPNTPKDAPGETVCWLRAVDQDRGYLRPDGSYVGVQERPAWNDRKLLAFDLSNGGHGVALTADRKAIDENGKELGQNVAAVSCCQENYILLNMDGSVTTSKGSPQLPSAAQAVCAAIDGYWVAAGKELLHLNQKGELLSSVACALDELQRDSSGETVFGRAVDGTVQKIGGKQ